MAKKAAIKTEVIVLEEDWDYSTLNPQTGKQTATRHEEGAVVLVPQYVAASMKKVGIAFRSAEPEEMASAVPAGPSIPDAAFAAWLESLEAGAPAEPTTPAPSTEGGAAAAKASKATAEHKTRGAGTTDAPASEGIVT